METARYGRMNLGRCLSRDYMVGCAADVIRHADERCSGKHECVIKVPDETLHEVQPCPKDILAYMEAGYTCVPGRYHYNHWRISIIQLSVDSYWISVMLFLASGGFAQFLLTSFVNNCH